MVDGYLGMSVVNIIFLVCILECIMMLGGMLIKNIDNVYLVKVNRKK